MKWFGKVIMVVVAVLVLLNNPSSGLAQSIEDVIYELGQLEPIDSVLKVKAGQPAPDFTLPSINGRQISLSQFRGNKNVVISFVPAAWTQVCSNQWPGYNVVKKVFAENDAVLLGITVDNIPSLHAWTRKMGGLWFYVLSDFWPHGAVAKRYGVLRSNGLAERALLIVDKKGILRFVLVSDINKTPDLATCTLELERINNRP